MKPKTLLLLGATGFVGRNLASRLLAQGHRLLCLVRGRGQTSGALRLRAVLRPFFPEDAWARVTREQLKAVEGEITRPGLGLPERLRQWLSREVDEVWHCAAKLSFAERHRQEVEHCNVWGLKQVLALVRGSRVQRFHYLSTAYVAGRRPGLIPESLLDDAYGFKNPYEWSKWQAERLLGEFAQRDGVPVTIYRPAIIVGGVQPGTVAANGLYRVAAIIGRVAIQYGIRHQGWRLRIPGPPDRGLNLVPLHYVVAALVALADAKLPGTQVFHLVNPRHLPNPEVVGALGDALNLNLKLAGPEDFESEPMTLPERVLANTIRTYLPYLHDRLVFDDTNTRLALGGKGVFCPPLTREKLARLLAYGLESQQWRPIGEPVKGSPAEAATTMSGVTGPRAWATKIL